MVSVAAGLSGLNALSDRRQTQTYHKPKNPKDENWSKIRSHFILEKELVYMNNASLGMPPVEVVESVQKGYNSISKNPLSGKNQLQSIITNKVVPGLSKLFGTDEDEIVLTRNASEALFLQTNGLNLNPGDEVVVSTQEHPAALQPWNQRKINDRIHLKPVYIPSPLKSDEDTINRLFNATSSKTKAISFCHVTRGGHKYPVEKISRIAKSKGIATLVDGAQAVGQFPINISELGCDAYAASLHKWILAPSGTGFMYINKASLNLFSSPFGRGFSTINRMFNPPGTKDLPVRAAINSAIKFINSIGIKNIDKRCRFLSNYLKAGLRDVKGVKILSSNHDQSAPGSTIFEKKDLDAINSVNIFEDRINYFIDEHQRDGHNAIRISTHFYNTTEEIDLLVEELKKL